ncbi:nodulation protein NfeD [Ureibacillus sp. NPDC094379]
MKKLRHISLLFLILFSFSLWTSSYTAQASDKVFTVPIENEVEKGLEVFLKRSFDEAMQQRAKAIILEIHTPGGFVDAAYDIAKLMDQTPIRTIAFINSKAHSAGAFLALHADEIYMVPSGTIGAAAIIDGKGNAANTKANSAWLAAMKAAAEISERDPKYALAMADIQMDLPEYRAPTGELLTLSADEAFKVHYSEGTAKDLDEVLELANLSNSEIVHMELTFSEKLARFITNPIVVTLLLSIASIGLMIELFSPGFGLPGLTGLFALSLFFFGHTIAGFAGYETIIMFIIGFILLIAELFVPGGIVGFIGGALVVTSLLFSGASVVHMAYSILIAVAIAIIGMVVLMKFFGKNLHLFNKLILRDATTTEEGYVSNINRIELLGKTGVTLTPLRPAGTIQVGKERIDVVSEGSYIGSNKKVEIIEVEGSRVVVREMKIEQEEQE